MARPASPALMARVRALVTELTSLEQALKNHGDREAAEVIRAAKRDVATAIRQGIFSSRGENV